MAVVIASGATVSVAANAKSADQVTGTYQHVGPGIFTLVARGTIATVNAICTVGGVDLVNDQPIPSFGTTGAMDTSAHLVATQALPGGRIELFFRNTGAASTVDFILYWEPIR